MKRSRTFNLLSSLLSLALVPAAIAGSGTETSGGSPPMQPETPPFAYSYDCAVKYVRQLEDDKRAISQSEFVISNEHFGWIGPAYDPNQWKSGYQFYNPAVPSEPTLPQDAQTGRNEAFLATFSGVLQPDTFEVYFERNDKLEATDPNSWEITFRISHFLDLKIKNPDGSPRTVSIQLYSYIRAKMTDSLIHLNEDFAREGDYGYPLDSSYDIGCKKTK